MIFIRLCVIQKNHVNLQIIFQYKTSETTDVNG
jgi:hypothetical protein